jgi:4,5-dihydroxyphthalate decarboxylase
VAKLNISIATWDYDRVRPLMDGRVRVEGCDLNHVTLSPEEAFLRAWYHQEFEVSEIGLSGYVAAISRGEEAFGLSPYVAIPVFLSRMFRASAIYIRTDRGIETPLDLKGKRVGVPEYQITAAVWARGFLADEYGLKAEDVQWLQGGMDNPGRKDKWPNNLLKGFPLSPIEEGETLNRLFEEGHLDALICPRTPRAYRDGKTPVRRLFDDFETVDKNYFRKTGIYPIMHCVGIRRDVHAEHPWLAASLMKAFTAAKKISEAELFETAALKIGMPWIVSASQAAREVLGDLFPYGFASSRRTLEAMCRYSVEQGIAARRVEPEELFVKSTLDEAKT